MELFKTLIFKSEKEQTTLGKYAHIIGGALAGGEIPQLMTPQTTMKLLKKAYPKHIFKGVELITLEVRWEGEEEELIPAIPPEDYKGSISSWMVALQERGLWGGEGWHGDVMLEPHIWWEILEACED